MSTFSRVGCELIHATDIFPKRLSALLRYPAETDADMTALLRRFYNSSGTGSLDPITLVKRAIPSDMPLKVTEILPRLKDGGAFVKVQFDASVSPSDIECKLFMPSSPLVLCNRFPHAVTSRVEAKKLL